MIKSARLIVYEAILYILALTLNASAYISEVIRAGILSIDAGQMEAARTLGMSYWQAGDASLGNQLLPQTV